jgi:hypothetical protein
MAYIYILYSPSLSDTIKIGRTKRRCQTRARELNKGDYKGATLPFVVRARFKTSSPKKHEAEIHSRLAHVRKGRQELFQIELTDAIRVIESVIHGSS